MYKNQTNNLLSKLFKAGTTQKAAEIAEIALKEFKEAYTNPHTLKTYVSQFRRTVKSQNIKPIVLNEFLDKFRVSDITMSLNENYRNSVSQTSKGNTDNLIILTEAQVNQIIQVAINWTISGNYPQKVAALCVLTGRRPAEIMTSANFEAIPTIAPFTGLIFSGQLKKKDNPESFVIPTLCEPEIILDCFHGLNEAEEIYCNSKKRVRQPKDNSNRTIQVIYHDKYSKYIDECFKELHPSLSGQKVRAMYVQALLTVFSETSWVNYYQYIDGDFIESQMTIAGFCSSILGHKENDLTAAQSYLRHIQITK